MIPFATEGEEYIEIPRPLHFCFWMKKRELLNQMD